MAAAAVSCMATCYGGGGTSGSRLCQCGKARAVWAQQTSPTKGHVHWGLRTLDSAAAHALKLPGLPVAWQAR